MVAVDEVPVLVVQADPVSIAIVGDPQAQVGVVLNDVAELGEVAADGLGSLPHKTGVVLAVQVAGVG